MWPHRCSGRRQSLWSPPFPLSVYVSPPIRGIGVCGARRTAWTWRCLGSVTHGETTIASASSYRRTEHFEADLESTFNCIIFGKHFFRPPFFKSFFLSFPVSGWDSDLLLAAAAVGLDDFPSYPRVIVTTEEWERSKQICRGSKLYRSIFLDPKREDDTTGQHDSGRKWGQRGRTGQDWWSQISERQPAGN